MAVMGGRGNDEGVLRALRGMYVQVKRMCKIKGCLGGWWVAKNGVLLGCSLRVIVIKNLKNHVEMARGVAGPGCCTPTPPPTPPPLCKLAPKCWTIGAKGALRNISLI